ncbi:MAG: 50S ribosomal protein L23 [Candidatus Shikimatogenerans bostrichidophilus]|nr:MAG: 50S ribosomal protein L23 [Candidatus Shikimatogenerans bostrichidophilus]
MIILLIYPLKTNKSFFLYKKYNIYTFLIKNKKVNKIEIKKYFNINYSIKINKINIINVKKKKKNFFI